MKRLALITALLLSFIAAPVLAADPCGDIMAKDWSVTLDGVAYTVQDCRITNGPDWQGVCTLVAQKDGSPIFYGVTVRAVCKDAGDITIADVPCALDPNDMTCYGLDKSELDAMQCIPIGGKSYCFPEDKDIPVVVLTN